MNKLNELANRIEENPTLRAKMVSNPEETIRNLAASFPLQTDVLIYRLVVAFLGGTLVSVMLGSIVLSFYGVDVPDILTAVGGAAVGSLGSLLSQPPKPQ
jgi:hypothetical protein